MTPSLRFDRYFVCLMVGNSDGHVVAARCGCKSRCSLSTYRGKNEPKPKYKKDFFIPVVVLGIAGLPGTGAGNFLLWIHYYTLSIIHFKIRQNSLLVFYSQPAVWCLGGPFGTPAISGTQGNNFKISTAKNPSQTIPPNNDSNKKIPSVSTSLQSSEMRCDLKLWITDPLTGVSARRCYRIQKSWFLFSIWCGWCAAKHIWCSLKNRAHGHHYRKPDNAFSYIENSQRPDKPFQFSVVVNIFLTRPHLAQIRSCRRTAANKDSLNSPNASL